MIATKSSRHRTTGIHRIAIVEDHRLQRLRTEDLLNREPAFQVVHSSETLEEFIAWTKDHPPRDHPNILILDLMVDHGPSADPDQVQRLIESGIKVLVLSAMASPTLVREILRAGVGGVVGKRDSEGDIIAAVWAILSGEEWMTHQLASVIAGDGNRPQLSEQEERALVLYASGLTLDAVAQAMWIKPDTAKTYLDRVKKKYAELGRPVRSKVELSKAAVIDGFVDLSE